VGRQLFGRYELLRKLAAGGMAEVFLARQWGRGGFFRDVVIKRLFRHLCDDERQLRMFQDEARLLAELCHPNIPQVFDLGVEDGQWYLAMEWVDGHVLSDLLMAGARSHQPMPLPVALGIVIQLCEALHHAHERRDKAGRPLRIVHRDVTPQNVMVTRDGVAKMLDFGIARTAARKETDAGAVRGTFAYMAPEQVRARPLDKRADVFALGVVLYELTTGTRLFRGTDVQVMTQIVEQDVPPPSTRRPGYPQELEQIVLHALQRDRAMRTPSASHLAVSLEEFATRSGMVVGPRTVARYVAQVFPYERLADRSAAIVEEMPHLELVPEPPEGLDLVVPAVAPHAYGADPYVVADASQPTPAVLPGTGAASALEVLGDETLFDDLALLAQPPPESAVVDAHDPLTLPPDALQEPVDFEAVLLESLPPAAFDALPGVDPALDLPRPPRPPSKVGPMPRAAHPSLSPDVLETADDDAERPVLLLTPQRPPSAPPRTTGATRDAGTGRGGGQATEPAAGANDARSAVPSHDYMSELSRRIEYDE
jgi:serine/threonine-protein kinase